MELNWKEEAPKMVFANSKRLAFNKCNGLLNAFASLLICAGYYDQHFTYIRRRK